LLLLFWLVIPEEPALSLPKGDLLSLFPLLDQGVELKNG
jgi:hypothetical protein